MNHRERRYDDENGSGGEFNTAGLSHRFGRVNLLGCDTVMARDTSAHRGLSGLAQSAGSARCA